MIREPLSPSDEPNGPANDPRLPTPPEAWAALGFATLFIILAFYHIFLMFKRKAWLTWTLVAASVTQNISMLAHAYDLGYPPSLSWYVVEGLVYPLAPTLIMIVCIQTFGRAAWHSAVADPTRLTRFWGFLRWNTAVFITFMVFSYLFFLVGNIITVTVAPDAVAREGSNAYQIRCGIAMVEAGLMVQSMFLLALVVLIWQWRSVSRTWDVEWDQRRRMKWTWKQLLTATLVCVALLIVRQIFMLLVFFGVVWGLNGLNFVFDVSTLLVCLIILSIWHPGRCLPQRLTTIRLNTCSMTARKRSAASSETDSEAQKQ